MIEPSALTDIPRVSVVMAVHNGEKFLEAAVRSMMDQTLRDIEIVVVDDASTDASPDILAQLAAEDPRIRIVTLPENRNIPRAVNAGLEVARAPLVARMDADDISYPGRLAAQAAFLDGHPEIVAVGAGVRRVRIDGSPIRITAGLSTPAQNRWRIRFRLPFQNPTTMFRRLPGGAPIRYDPDYLIGEDHEFFARLLSHGEIACLPDVLLDYRIHGQNTTVTKWVDGIEKSDAIRRKFVAAELPTDVAAALDPVLRALAGTRDVSAKAIFAGLRQMLAHDLAAMPAEIAFLRSQTAQVAYQALRRSGLSKPRTGLAFLRHGADMLTHLAYR